MSSLIMNVLVIVVTCKNKSLQNSQSSFKISLAIADIVYAVVTIPSVLLNLLKFTKSTLEVKEFELEENRTFLFSRFTDVYQTGYVNVFGFVCFTVLLVSIYTLLAASADRLFAVLSPIRYRSLDTKKLSKKICAAVWIFCMTVASIPLYAEPYLYYGVVFGVLFLLDGFKAQEIYIMLLVLPILSVLVISTVTYYYTKKHIRKAKNLCSNVQKNRKTELKLAKTLIQMVAAFCFMTLPLTVLIIFYVLTPNLNPRKPREFDIKKLRVLYSLEFFGYVCLTCATIWNFLIYNIKNDNFRKGVVKVLINTSKKLRFPLLVKIFRSSDIFTKTIFVIKNTKASTTSSPNEQVEMIALNRNKNSGFESYPESLLKNNESIKTAKGDVK